MKILKQSLYKSVKNSYLQLFRYSANFYALIRVNTVLGRKSTHFEHKVIIVIIIMVIFKCYFSGEHIALSIKKQNNSGVNIELGKTNRLKALCMMQINTRNKQTMCQ